jgi:hypothetical protein
MSADNGIYILKTNRRNFENVKDGYEYRVAHCAAIDNIIYEPLKYLPMFFGDSKVYNSYKDARMEANKKYNRIMNSSFAVLEHGICDIDFTSKIDFFP